MNRQLIAVGLVFVVAFSAPSREPDKRMVQLAGLFTEMADALKSVKDESTAKAALPKLQRLDKQIDTSMRDLEKAKFEDDAVPEALNKAGPVLDKEIRRVDSDPKTHKLVHDLSVFRRQRQASEMKARLDVFALSRAVEQYKITNGKYPNSITALGEKQPDGGAPLVRKDSLRDPWGGLYQIDPNGPRNKGVIADVYSLGHPVEKRIIGNWTDAKKKDKDEKKPR